MPALSWGPLHDEEGPALTDQDGPFVEDLVQTAGVPLTVEPGSSSARNVCQTA